MIGDKYHIGVDVGNEGGDKTCVCTIRYAGPFRKWLRKIGLDKSTWEYEIVKMEMQG